MPLHLKSQYQYRCDQYSNQKRTTRQYVLRNNNIWKATKSILRLEWTHHKFNSSQGRIQNPAGQFSGIAIFANQALMDSTWHTPFGASLGNHLRHGYGFGFSLWERGHPNMNHISTTCLPACIYSLAMPTPEQSLLFKMYCCCPVDVNSGVGPKP